MPTQPAINWNDVDTVLLDMDGTLLDLHYDNTVWNEVFPERWGEHHGIGVDAARDQLYTHMQEIYGELRFYCMDYWSSYAGLDVMALHAEATHLIQFRPSALDFLHWLGDQGKHRVLATNAHRDSLDIKHQHCGITDHLDVVASCHDFGAPKEDQAFWEHLNDHTPFDPARTLFIDDNAAVLESADRYGIANLLTITQPDSGKPHREGLTFPAFDDFAEIFPHPGANSAIANA